MELRPIKNDIDCEAMLEFVDQLFDNPPAKNTPQGEKLEIALLLIKDYEDKNFEIPFPDPIEAIKLKMEEKGLSNKGYVSSILSKRKPLTFRIAKILHEKLGISGDVMLS